jgi:hypothetical protein
VPLQVGVAALKLRPIQDGTAALDELTASNQDRCMRARRAEALGERDVQAHGPANLRVGPSDVVQRPARPFAEVRRAENIEAGVR